MLKFLSIIAADGKLDDNNKITRCLDNYKMMMMIMMESSGSEYRRRQTKDSKLEFPILGTLAMQIAKKTVKVKVLRIGILCWPCLNCSIDPLQLRSDLFKFKFELNYYHHHHQIVSASDLWPAFTVCGLSFPNLLSFFATEAVHFLHFSVQGRTAVNGSNCKEALVLVFAYTEVQLLFCSLQSELQCISSHSLPVANFPANEKVLFSNPHSRLFLSSSLHLLIFLSLSNHLITLAQRENMASLWASWHNRDALWPSCKSLRDWREQRQSTFTASSALRNKRLINLAAFKTDHFHCQQEELSVLSLASTLDWSDIHAHLVRLNVTQRCTEISAIIGHLLRSLFSYIWMQKYLIEHLYLQIQVPSKFNRNGCR